MRKLLWFLLVGMASAQTCITGTFATTPNLALKLPLFNQCNWGSQGYNPNFSAIDAMFPSGVLAKASGGTGTATPAIVAGTNITVSGTWPNQTVNSTASGSGTVTSFSAGNLSPLFTSSVATATATPALTFSLSTAAAHTFFGNNTGSTAAPGFQAIGEADVTSLVTDLGLKANAANAALTGVPTAPTAALSTNTTQLATTAFVIANAGAGTVTSVTGTSNQVTVTGTTTPVLSLPSTLIAPGTVTATTSLTSPLVTTSGSNGGIDGTEGTGAGLTAASGHDLLYADSTAHRLKMNNNNGGAKTVAAVEESTVGQYCGTTTTCSATAVLSPQEVYGHATLTGGSATVTAISPVFGATATTECFANDRTDATKTANAVLASTSSITLTGTGSDVIGYHCIGAK